MLIIEDDLKNNYDLNFEQKQKELKENLYIFIGFIDFLFFIIFIIYICFYAR